MKLRIITPEHDGGAGTRLWASLSRPRPAEKIEIVRFPSRLKQRPKPLAVMQPLLCPCEARRLRGLRS
jgi:hypothetical protein